MPQTYPKITVIIPTFNRAEYLAECLDSIIAQTLPAHQIIVINDGSTDHTVKVIENYLKSVEYFETGQLGKSCAINYGLERTSGEYIWIFDDDDVALPDVLERFVEPLEGHPEYGFSYSTFFYSATRAKDGRIGRVLRESKIPDIRKRGFLIPLLESNFLGGAAIFVRTSCYKQVGNFDSELLRSQDYNMAVRLARGFKGIQVRGGATFHYRQHKGLRGNLKDRFFSRFALKKWLHYDQIFFRGLYRELPLSEFLPPGSNLENKTRQALLQRLEVMASKLLIEEVVKDLQKLGTLSDSTPFSDMERAVIVDMITRSRTYKVGSIYAFPEFCDTIRRLSISSPVIRLLRAEILRALPLCLKKPRPYKILNAIGCLFQMYF